MAPLGNPDPLLLRQATPYQIEQSLRFDGGAQLAKTFGSTGNGRIWSLSVWLKRAGGIGDNDRDIFGAYTGSYARIGLVECGAGPSPDHFGVDQGGPASNGTYYANGRRRDPSAWYHLVVSVDYNTPSVKIWINGVLEGAAQNSLAADGGLINSAGVPHHIGSRVTVPSGNNRWLGYMAEFHFLDTDSQLSDPNDFGEFNNGVWRPIKYTGSYGDNGFYMKFDPTATNGIGHDHSGNGNNFSPSGFTTSGTGTDVMSDTPTTNFPTFNPLLPGPSNFSEGNLSVTANNSGSANRGTPNPTFKMPSSGKYYAEFTPTSIGEIAVALTQEGNGDTVINYYRLGTISLEGSGTVGTGSSYTTGDVIGVAVDVDNTTVRFYKNGTAQLSSATDYSSAPDSDNCYLTFKQGSSSGSCTATANYGQRAFEYGPPTGFKALNTSNLPVPTVKDGSEYFNTVLYTGNGGTNAITNVGFQPDLTWIKLRNAGSNHSWYDVLRGTNKVIGSSAPDAETTDGSVTPTASGFTLSGENSSFGSTNGTGYTYAAWNWLAGGSGSTNTVGSITSTVSANPSAGFSIVSYTGNGSAGATIGHGLNVAPSFYVIKNRDDGTLDWGAYHGSLGATKRLILSTAAGAVTDSTFWNNTEPTHTTFSVGTAGNTNGNTKKMIAYCFAEVEGYSKFTSYTGNNNNDGVFCYLGFEPSWLLIKGTNAAYWYIWDEQRSTYNAATKVLLPSEATGEQDNTTRSIDFLSNGFKLRTNDTNINANGQQYIVAAFASNPFGGSGVSPATAR